MKLGDIIKNCGILEVKGTLHKDITDVTNDSRKVTPGSLFVAVNGCGADGRAYIAKAIENGASAVMFEGAQDCPAIPERPEGVTYLFTDNSRKAVAMAADSFYSHPSGSIKLVGITGTNGKTTTVTLLYRLFRSL
ncbi:MAG: UDP-N-acetylmuramoyl-L-alanyl-D-glutamate--2,6-diaminopimelate ligase, partial [Bacteroidales bacterium]|nr:UDP-N-acetylmuramoyl-L-alanyl-D-glutamate--2,6-diaminopimelate ligase [Bacteroidales bacterium]